MPLPMSLQDALHVGNTRSFWQRWSTCTNKLDYHSTAVNLPRDVYPTLIKNYRVLIFNGDVDACVPVTDNEAWTSNMGFEVSEPWRAWEVDEQVAGYVTSYKTEGEGSFQFITVKGAGTLTPRSSTASSLLMLNG